MALNLQPVSDDPARRADLVQRVAEQRRVVREIAQSKQFDRMPEARHDLRRLQHELKAMDARTANQPGGGFDITSKSQTTSPTAGSTTDQ